MYKPLLSLYDLAFFVNTDIFNKHIDCVLNKLLINLLNFHLLSGELVVLTRRVDNNWYEGRIGNRKGIFPVSYVTVLVEPGDHPSNFNKAYMHVQ